MNRTRRIFPYSRYFRRQVSRRLQVHPAFTGTTILHTSLFAVLFRSPTPRPPPNHPMSSTPFLVIEMVLWAKKPADELWHRRTTSPPRSTAPSDIALTLRAAPGATPRPRSLVVVTFAGVDNEDNIVVVVVTEGLPSEAGRDGTSSYGTTLRRECVKEASTCEMALCSWRREKGRSRFTWLS